MKKFILPIIFGVAVAVFSLVALSPLYVTPAPLPHRNPAQSWDQSNLKLADHGCPSAIYVAPKGELIECQLLHPGDLVGDAAHSIMPGYPTIERAAIEGLKAIALKPSANWYEWGGMIVKATNGYVPLPPDTSFAAQHVHINDQPGNVVGSFHTHVCNPQFAHEFFSPADLGEPIFVHRTVFMGDMCTGLVHRFKPGDKPDVAQAGEGGPFSSMGWIVGKFTTPHQAN